MRFTKPAGGGCKAATSQALVPHYMPACPTASAWCGQGTHDRRLQGAPDSSGAQQKPPLTCWLSTERPYLLAGKPIRVQHKAHTG